MRDTQGTPEKPEPLVDPLLAAKARGLRAQEALLEVAGGTLTTKGVATLLGGVGRQVVEKRRDGCTLLGLRMSGGAYVDVEAAPPRTSAPRPQRLDRFGR